MSRAGGITFSAAVVFIGSAFAILLTLMGLATGIGRCTRCKARACADRGPQRLGRD